MIQSRCRRLNPPQPPTRNNIVPRNRNLGVSAEDIRSWQLLGDSLLSGVHDFELGRNRRNLITMALFDGITKDNSHERDRSKEVAASLRVPSLS